MLNFLEVFDTFGGSCSLKVLLFDDPLCLDCMSRLMIFIKKFENSCGWKILKLLNYFVGILITQIEIFVNLIVIN